MISLLSKLETLVEEAIGLVREERARRIAAALKVMPTTVNPPAFVPFPMPSPHPDLGQPDLWGQRWVPPVQITCSTIRFEPPIAMTAWNVGCAGAINLGQVWTGVSGPPSFESH